MKLHFQMLSDKNLPLLFGICPTVHNQPYLFGERLQNVGQWGLDHSYCWWKKSCTTWDVKSCNNGINYLSTGAGFLPSTSITGRCCQPAGAIRSAAWNFKRDDRREECGSLGLVDEYNDFRHALEAAVTVVGGIWQSHSIAAVPAANRVHAWTHT